MTTQVLTTQVDLATQAWVRLLRGYVSASRVFNAQLTSEHGLTINDYEALLHLSRAEGQLMRRVDLASSLLLTQSGVTRLLDGLERHDLVEKASCPSDLRVTYAVLTDAGRKKLAEASESHVAGIRALFEEHFSRTELETLADLLGRLPGAGGDAGSCGVG
jgi:DNA-binding MarR family transcriptional regulator